MGASLERQEASSGADSEEGVSKASVHDSYGNRRGCVVYAFMNAFIRCLLIRQAPMRQGQRSLRPSFQITSSSPRWEFDDRGQGGRAARPMPLPGEQVDDQVVRTLKEMTWIYIAKHDSTFEKWMKNEHVLAVAEDLKQVIKLPNPCFPETMRDSDSGLKVVRDVDLLDMFVGPSRDQHVFMPASVGSMHSHRRAWHYGNHQGNKGAWLMVCEEDIEPTANARDKLRFIMQYILRNKGKHELVMLAGADGPMMNRKAKEHSETVTEAMRLVELRSLPMSKAGIHWVPKHVGLGVKWYLISPVAREFLLKVRYQFNSFERSLWAAIYKASGGPWDQSAKKPWERTLYATPPLGSNERNFQDFFVGSGRNRTDAMHQVGPYIAVVLSRDWPLGQRLTTIAVGVMLAALCKLGVVISWLLAGNDCCDIHIDDLIDFKAFPEATDIAFFKVVREDHGSGFGVYFGDKAQYQALRLEQPIKLETAIETLVGRHSQDPPAEELLQMSPAWRHFPLQLWTERAASSWIARKWLPEGLQTEAKRWPIVVWLGYQTGPLSERRQQSSRACKAQSKVKAKPMPGADRKKQCEIFKKLEAVWDFQSPIILLCGRPDFWNEGESTGDPRWHNMAATPVCLPFGREEMKNVKPQEEGWNKLESDDFKLRSTIVGATLAILCAAPTDKIVAEDGSWTLAWARGMRMTAEDFKAGSDPTLPPWKIAKSAFDSWWRSNGPKVTSLVLEGRLERSVIPLHMSEQLRSISAADIAEANQLINKALWGKTRMTASCLGTMITAGVSTLNDRRKEYMAMSNQLGRSGLKGVPGWLKAFVTFRVNKYRLEKHERPIIIDPDNYVLFGDVKPGATPAETLRELVADMAVTRSKTVV